MVILSPAFRDRIVSIHGQSGQEWLDNIPTLQADLVERWSLRDIQPLPDLSYNYLVFGITSENLPVVLKMGVPHAALNAEIQSLREFDGKGAVRLIDADAHQGALLLERIIPGDDLRSMPDDQAATRMAAGVMKELWKAGPTSAVFPGAADWCQGFQRYLEINQGDGPLPSELVQQASKMADDLLNSSQNQLLLHGDLHHRNILKTAVNTWIAIDPQGVIGEPAFEVGALLLNPVPDLINWPNLKEIQKQRLIILEEELHIDGERLLAWSFVRAVLSAIWSVEDGGAWHYGIRVAEALRALIIIKTSQVLITSEVD